VGAELQDANILRSDGNDSTETDLDVNMTSVELQKEGSIHLILQKKIV
jgi:hypothetical protein